MVRIKWPFRRGQPVGFPVVAWAFVLEVKVERPIGVGLKWHVTAHRETIESVPHLKAFGVVEGDRPEGVHWRCRALVKMEDVVVRLVERLAGVIEEVDRIDGVLREIRAEADLGNDGALEVVLP